MIIETLRLFNAVQLNTGKNTLRTLKRDVKNTLWRTMKQGYIVDPRLNLTEQELAAIEAAILDGKKLSATFHKTWAKVANSPIELLVLQQLFHYTTTYGFESLGIYDESFVYIPNEHSVMPEFDISSLKFLYVRALTAGEILVKILELDGSGIALSNETLNDIMVIIRENEYKPSFVHSLKNRELKTRCSILYDIAPDQPEEWLRYVIMKLTGESLLVKNSRLIKMIDAADGKILDKYIASAPSGLASIFLRYKPLFLALRRISNNKKFFNDLRRRAVTEHRPVGQAYLATVTSQIKNGTLSIPELKEQLKGASVWAKVRLAYALRYRQFNQGNLPIVYRVRTGRGWATETTWTPKDNMYTDAALYEVLRSIADNMDVKGKVFYVPEGVNYGIPASEKQFIGNIPQGTSVTIPKDMVVGVHWKDKNFRTDLDLSLLSTDGRKYGWNGYWRNAERSVLFSGDITSGGGPHGATELLYIKKSPNTELLCTVNNFTYGYNSKAPVEAQVFLASEDLSSDLRRGYMVAQNNIVLSAQVMIEQPEYIFGFILGDKMYFTNVALGNKVASRGDENTKRAIDYYTSLAKITLSLTSLLLMAGATVVHTIPEDGEYTDLTQLDKTSIISLF
jgi:hypothetical protein